MATDIDICNVALIRLGNDIITGFDDGDKGRACSIVYPSVKKMLLTMHPWRFATGKRKLSRLTASPTNEWLYAYQLPPDLIAGPWAVFNSADTGINPFMNWEIFEDKLYSNSEIIVIDYRYDVTEGKFPGWFQPLVELALCAALAPQLTGDENGNMAKHYHELAFGTPSENMQGGYFSACKGINGRTNPNSRIVSDDIVDARFS